MKFRFFIVDPDMGHVVGTNDEAVAQASAADDMVYVIDTQACQVLTFDGSTVDIEEAE